MASASAAIITPGWQYESNCLPEGRKVASWNNLPIPSLNTPLILDPFIDQTSTQRMSQITCIMFSIMSGQYDSAGQNDAWPAWAYNIGDGAFQNFNLQTPTNIPLNGSNITLGECNIFGLLPLLLRPGKKIVITAIQPGFGQYTGVPNAEFGNGILLTLNAYNFDVGQSFIQYNVQGFTD